MRQGGNVSRLCGFDMIITIWKRRVINRMQKKGFTSFCRFFFLVAVVMLLQGVCLAADRLPSDVKNNPDAILHLSVQDAKGEDFRRAFYIIDGNSFIGSDDFPITKKIRIVPKKMEFNAESQSLYVSFKLLQGNEELRAEAFELKYDESAKIEFKGFVIYITCRAPVKSFI